MGESSNGNGQARFTLRQLQHFVAACDTGSLTLAAQREDLTQSAVSASIGQLERSLGVKLLLRHHALGVTPTAEGRHFLEEARHLIRQSRELDRKASELAGEVTGRLDVGFSQNLAPMIAARLCREFTATYPDVRVTLVEEDQAPLVAALRDGDIALGITNNFDLPDQIRFEPMLDLPPFVLLAAGHPAASRPFLTIEELATMPMVRFERGGTFPYHRSLFQAYGLEPTVRYTTQYAEMVRSLVGNGYGFAIFNSRPMAGHSIDGRPLVAVPLAGDHRVLQYGVSTWINGGESKLTTTFRDFTRTALTTGDKLGLAPVTVEGGPVS